MPRLPFLIGEFAISYFKKTMVVLRRLLVGAQMIVGGCPKKVADRDLRYQFGAGIQRFDRQIVILVFTGGDRQVSVGSTQLGLLLDSGEQFFLRLGKFALFQKGLSQCQTYVSVLRLLRQH